MWTPLFFAVFFAPAVLYGTYLHDPILSHNIAEIFCVVVACGIFMLAWNAREFIDNYYFVFLGISYLFVGGFDFLHNLTFSELLGKEHRSISIEFWFFARFLQIVGYLMAPLFLSRKFRPSTVIVGFSIASAALGWMLHRGMFPDYYVPGKGLTHFKLDTEYIIVVMLMVAISVHWWVREQFDRGIFRLIVLSLIFSAATDFSTILYTDDYIYNSVIGHYLKFLSYYMVYRAFIATGLVHPYRLLYRNLQLSTTELRAARDMLESQVAVRTAELQGANRRLEEELAERRKAAAMRELMLNIHQLTQATDNVRDLLSGLSRFLQARFGFEAVGIRYHQDTDSPYFSTRGFSSEFVEEEISLCPPDQTAVEGERANGGAGYECVCGAVIEKRFDPALPYFTPNGAFWTNDASNLFTASGEFRILATRGRCVRQGYETIAIVPLRLGDSTFGLLQFHDRRKGLITPHILEQIERVAENLSGVLARLLAQEALRESEDRFRSLVENSSVAICIYQRKRILYANPRLEQMFGAHRRDMSFRELGSVHPEDTWKFTRLCEEMDQPVPAPQDVDIRFLALNVEREHKEMHWIRCQATPINFRTRASLLVEMTDITRVRELEHIVQVREKLASLGHLAAGIAHEIRNPLSGINISVSTLDLLCQQADGLDPEERENIRQVVAQAEAASEKISTVIKRVLDFTRPAPPRMERMDLIRVVRDALALSAVSVRKSGIELREHLPPESLYCHADPSLLEQVVLNLVANALHAMENSERPGRLTLRAAVEGGRAVLRVADTGPGVPEYLREKIFEPFFTTRKDGYGIGLSFSRRIVTDHGGHLTVDTAEGGGAEFRVELPLAEERGRT